MPKEKETTPKVEKEETVEVSKDKLDAILAHQAGQDKELEILRASVSQGRLEQETDKRKDKELPRAYLKVFMGKVVIGWESTAAKIVHNPTTGLAVGEVLQANYKFNDGSESGLIDQVEFTRAEEREHVRIQERVDGQTVRVKFENLALSQEPFDIKEAFLNP